MSKFTTDTMPYKVKATGGRIAGLSFMPTLEPEVSDWMDSVPRYHALKSVPEEFSARNREALSGVLRSLPKCRAILEIGVQRQPLPGNSQPSRTSSTSVLQKLKPDDAIYLGVDLRVCSEIHNPDRRCYFIQIDSRRRQEVMGALAWLGRHQIDLLMIDGNHSVAMVLNDWRYTEWLSPDGVVVMHDSSVHPGPYALFEAVDPSLYHKQKLFADHDDDWGLAIFRRRS